MAGVSVWLFVRRHGDRELYRKTIRLGAAVTLLAGLGVAISGDVQGKIMTEVQPMKMAAAEGLYETSDSCAPFSVFTVGTPDGKHEKFAVTVPCLLSFLGTGTFDGKVAGHQRPARGVHRRRTAADPGATYYTPGDYTPVIPVTYWTLPLHDRPRPGRRGRLGAAAVGHPQGSRAQRPLARHAGDRAAAGPARAPTRSAGSSPRWAASRGRSSG